MCMQLAYSLASCLFSYVHFYTVVLNQRLKITLPCFVTENKEAVMNSSTVVVLYSCLAMFLHL